MAVGQVLKGPRIFLSLDRICHRFWHSCAIPYTHSPKNTLYITIYARVLEIIKSRSLISFGRLGIHRTATEVDHDVSRPEVLNHSAYGHQSGHRFLRRPCITVQEPVSELADIRAIIEYLGLGSAMVDLGCRSVDAFRGRLVTTTC